LQQSETPERRDLTNDAFEANEDFRRRRVGRAFAWTAALGAYLGAATSIRVATLDWNLGSPETGIYFGLEAAACGLAATWLLVRRTRLAGTVLLVIVLAAAAFRFAIAPASVPYSIDVWIYAVASAVAALGLAAAWLAAPGGNASGA
jgi:hypothetical protein